MAKKFFSFIMLCLYVLGVLGGLGWTIYSKGYAIAVALVAVAYMAFPKAKEYLSELTQ